MAYGIDVAELLADLKAKDEQIARLAPGNFTEPEIRVTIDALQQTYTPERVHHEMRKEAASAIAKLQAMLQRFEADRRRDVELVQSLTEEERRIILDLRARNPR